MKPIRIGITGSKGFIGRHLITYLRNTRYGICCFEGNLLISEEIVYWLKHDKPDVVIHLAGKFFGTTDELVRGNTITTMNLLEQLKKTKISKLLYASSGAVYGSTEKLYSKETDHCLPKTVYAVTKYASEQLIRLLNEKYLPSYTILRFPNVYGPSSSGVISELLDSTKTFKRVIRYGNGDSIRQFLSVGDACRAIHAAIISKSSGIYNITNPKIYTINDIITFIKKHRMVKMYEKPSNNELQFLMMDSKKASSELQFSSVDSIEEYIKKQLS